MGLRFRVLGPVEVTVDGEPVHVTGRQLVLLSALLLHANDPVPVAQLAGWLWDGDPPRGVRNAIQAIVLRLRKLLGTGVIRTVPDGYLLPADESTVDLAEFNALLADASAAENEGRLDRAADALAAA